MSYVNPHPAITAHHLVAVIQAEEPEDGTNYIPNHNQLSEYLYQLPKDKEYVVVDPESGRYDWGSLDVWHESYTLIGLDVRFRDEHGNYGGCQLMSFKSGQTGLMIYINGCSLSSAPSYYVVPTDVVMPKLAQVS